MAEVVVVDSGETPRKNRRLWLWIPLNIVLIIAIAVGGFLFWALNPLRQVDELALNALESSDNITITDRAWLAFLPHEAPSTGFIFYPGARTPAEAYAPIARQIAEEGYLVVIVYPPLNLAIFNTDLALPVMEHFSAVDYWVVGGHAMGGSVAATFARNNLDIVDGLVFMASYPRNNTLVNTELDTMLIYGSNDGLTAATRVEASRNRLPVNSTFVRIEGGNHAQFAFYGEKGGDNAASISREQQIAQIIQSTLALLERVDAQ